MDHRLLDVGGMSLVRIAVTSVFITACAAEPPGAQLDDPTGGSDGKADGAALTGAPAQLPIVLVHGFNASPTHGGFGPEVVRALCADGHAVFAPALPPFASVETRAEVLASAIDDALAGAPDACGVVPAELPAAVNIIAHSMGGLDARFTIASLGYGERVASLTTLSTPHRGSAVADMALGLTSRLDPQALVNLGTLLARSVESPTTLEPDIRAAFTSLAEANADAFNRDNPDDPRVHYESWAGLSNVAGIPNPQDLPACEHRLTQFRSTTARHHMHIALKTIAFVVAHETALRPNDGLVQVASAKWGTFRGCVPADHIDEVGAFATSWSPFDHVRFLRQRAFELAAAGY
jgi:triacylglycerol lipase